MPKRVIEFFAIDILISIEKARKYSQSYDSAEEFHTNEMAFAATLRELEIIGEAVRAILEHPPYDQHVKQKWRIIVDCRNVIAHEYFGISYNEISKIIYRDLPIFEEEFINFLKKINRENLFQAVEDIKKEFAQSKRFESLEYLEKIEALLKL